jgi:hypothetical protein
MEAKKYLKTKGENHNFLPVNSNSHSDRVQIPSPALLNRNGFTGKFVFPSG